MKAVKNTIGERINNNLLLFLIMIFGIIFIYLFLNKFYHLEKIGIIYFPFAFTTDGIFSNEKMFVTSLLYSIIGIGIIVYLFINKFIKGNKKRSNKWYYKIIIFTVIGVYGLFYITNPWYTLQTHPRLFFYQDGKNITNKEIYFFLTERYGFKGDLYKPFKTLEDSIDGLEFAMRINEPSLYMRIFKDLKNIGYKKVLDKYYDKTFQSYFLRRMTNINVNYFEEKEFFLNNLNSLNYLEKNASDMILVDIVKYTKEQYIKLKNGIIKENDFYNDINKYGDKIYDVRGIHLNMFIQSNILKYKKNQNGDWEKFN